MIPGIQEIKSLAIKYSKKQLANMAQMGLIDPQKAVMAGMMRDRIAKEDMQPPSTTVAQDVLGMGPQAQAQTQPQMRPQMGMQPQPQMPPQQALAGIEALPAGNVGNYAGGGIVAFGDGGDIPGYAGAEESVVRTPRYNMRFEDLPIYSAPSSQQRIEPAGSMGEFFSNIGTGLYNVGTGIADLMPSGAEMNQSARGITGRSGTAGGFQRIDPVTGKPISFGDFLRLQEAERSQTPVVVTAPPPAPAPKDKRGSRNRGDSTPPPPPPAAPTGKSMILEAPTFKPFDMNAVKIKGATLPVPKVEEIKDIRAARRAVEAEEGVDPEMYTKMIKGVEEKKGKLEGRKGEAAGQALMMAGLGLIGARRGQEFEALSASGQKALAAYKDDMKDLRNASEKYDERMEALRIADQQARKTNSAADIAKRDTQEARARAAELEVFKAENELAKTGAQVSANVYSTEIKRDVDLFQTRQAATTAQEQLKMEKYKADLSARVQGAYTNAIRAGQLDERRARTLIEAAESFIKNNVNTPAYLNNPQLLQQDAMAYAERLAAQFMQRSPGGQNAPTAAPSNRPPLSSFGR